METEQDGDAPASGSFLIALGLEMLPPDGELSRGRGLLGPGTWARDEQRPRLGALATMVDVVAGLRPAGALMPTVDMSVQTVRPLPAHGAIDLECRPLKHGRRLFVGEVLVHHERTLLARSVITFLNQRSPHSAGWQHGPSGAGAPATPFDDWLRPKYADARTVLIEPVPSITNGPGATIQGGAQATAAELAAEWVLAPSGAFAVTELDFRYLGPLKAGPLAATGDVLAVHDDRAFVSVRLTDAGAGDRTVGYATAVCRPRPSPS